MGAAGMRPVRPKLPYEPAPVQLHIYDIGTTSEVWAANNVLRALGAGGAFHCGVEVYGREWSYEMGTGIFACQPRCCEDHSYRESLAMGKTSLSEGDVLDVIAKLKLEWPGSDYDVLRKNCCHLSDELCKRIGVGSVPPWVSELACTIAAAEGVVADAVHSKGCCSVTVDRGQGGVVNIDDTSCGNSGLWCSGLLAAPASDAPVVKTLVCRCDSEPGIFESRYLDDRTPRAPEEVIPHTVLQKPVRTGSGAPHPDLLITGLKRHGASPEPPYPASLKPVRNNSTVRNVSSPTAPPRGNSSDHQIGKMASI